MTNAHRILYTLEGENRYNNNIIELSILTYRDRCKGVCMSETVIRVVRLGKQFRVAGAKENYKTLGKAISQMASSPLRAIQRIDKGADPKRKRAASRVWALKDISFEVKRGEVLGVIGHNGAGKSTLFKILSRITDPTEGYADIDGRVGSLLEVGTGFHGELSGRENTYLSGAILGMKRHEIDRRFDEIVAFSEVKEYIDTPVKHYSSGMYLRLAFAVAAHLEPEILIVDEVLAVGDAAFQKKCLNKMSDVARSGKTVLFVSHNMSAIVRMCHTGVLLKNGRMVYYGDAGSAVQQYMAHSVQLAGAVTFDLSARPWERLRAVAFTGARIRDGEGALTPTIRLTHGCTVEIDYRVRKPIKGAQIAFRLWNNEGICVLTSTDFDAELNRGNIDLEVGDYTATCPIPSQYLRPGSYLVDLISTIPSRENLDEQPQCLGFEVLDDGSVDSQLAQTRLGVVAPILAWRTERAESLTLSELSSG